MEQLKSSTKKEMTPAEIEGRRLELIKFYKSQISLVRLETEYEEHLTRIEVAKMQRFEIMLMKAQMMKDPDEEKTNNLKSEENANK